ncbi:transcription antitermination factor NusB [Isosphaeraceae bacterium EP7]
MPVLRRQKDGTGYFIVSTLNSRIVTHPLTEAGERELLESMGLKEGDHLEDRLLRDLIEYGLALSPEDVPPPRRSTEAQRAASPFAPRDEVETPEPEAEPAPTLIETPEPPVVMAPIARRIEESELEAASAPVAPVDETPEGLASRSPLMRRTRCREISLQVLYQAEQNEGVSTRQISRFINRRLRGDADQINFAIDLIDGVQEHQETLDNLISRFAENWRIDRMAAIDRNILRLGAFELLYSPDVPARLAINEALELAKRYSTAQSSRFVNGILDRLQGIDPNAPLPPLEPEVAPEVEAEKGPEVVINLENRRPSSDSKKARARAKRAAAELAETELAETVASEEADDEVAEIADESLAWEEIADETAGLGDETTPETS